MRLEVRSFIVGLKALCPEPSSQIGLGIVANQNFLFYGLPSEAARSGDFLDQPYF